MLDSNTINCAKKRKMNSDSFKNTIDKMVFTNHIFNVSTGFGINLQWSIYHKTKSDKFSRHGL